MIDVTVKTLDSQNHVFNVEEENTVKQFKEVISPTIGIPVDQQRLIFRGRVLQDDKKLSEYNVANSVVHVVQRPANQNNTSNDEPRPNSQAGNRIDGHGGIMFAGDDGTGGGGRNAIIMGAIGLPTIDIEGNPLEDGNGQPTPRRSGAAIRLMIGNQMLNRASTLLQQLEDDDAVTAATSAASSSTEQNSSDNEASTGNDTPMDIDDEAGSIERMISQVVNVSSAAALVAAIRQVQPPGSGSSPSASATSTSNNQTANNTSGANSTPASTSGVSSGANANNVSSEPRSDTQPSPARRPDSPRLRELATALQDLLALQDRLNPFLRYIQDALRQNRLYSEPGETQSTQFVFDTTSSILHMLSHSLHAFSDIMCDFSITPEDRRLTASSSIMVEQSTVVRATIPVALPAGYLTAGGNGITGGGQGINVNIGGGNNNTPGFPFAIGTPGLGMPFAPQQVWRNPNLPVNIATPPAHPIINTIPTTINPQNQNPPSSVGPGNQQNQNSIPGLNIQGGMMPPGLQNLGALLGMAGPGMMNIFGPGGPMQGGQVPVINLRANNAAGVQSQQQTASASAGVPSGQTNVPLTPTAPVTVSAENSTASSQQPGQSQNSGTAGTESNNNNNVGGMFPNLQQFRNELNRPQFDILLPCHTHHLSNRSRSNRNRPAEFRRFVNVDSDESSGSGSVGSAEEEVIEIIVDLLRHSRLVDLLQPMVKDVVLNYLMRGRDPKNEAHVRTCAKGLAKKILPFFEKFSSNLTTSRNESVDISATYTNILTTFVASLMQKVLGQSPGGDGQFKVDLFSLFADLQKQLIKAFKVCYPNSVNVGLLFVNYIVEKCLGGMSIIFKGQVRQKLLDHLKEVEKKCDAASASDPSSNSSVVVYKPAEASSSVLESPSVSSTSTLTATAPVSSRCAASFGGNDQPSVEATVTSPSGNNTVSDNKGSSLTMKPITDDVDIDEVLQLPPTMTQPQTVGASATNNALRRSAPGHSDPADSIASHLRNLPSEWIDTIQQDIRRQVELPSQPPFSPGYNTLFPRKH